MDKPKIWIQTVLGFINSRNWLFAIYNELMVSIAIGVQGKLKQLNHEAL